MAIVNHGAQEITFDYKEPLQGKEFNKLLKNTVKPGIYEEGTLTRISDTSVQIAPFVAYLNVDTDKLVRVQTSAVVTVTVSPVNNLIYMYYEWDDVIENWVNFEVRSATDSPIVNEIKIGKCNFAGSVLVDFDYSISYRDFGLFDVNYNTYLNDATINGAMIVTAGALVSGDLRTAHDPSDIDNHSVGNRLYNDRRYLLRDQGFDAQFQKITDEFNKVETVNLEQQLRLNLLEGRQYSNSEVQIDNYMSEEMSFDYETSSNIAAEIMDDNDWYNNIKETPDGTAPTFKPGFIRPRKQPYMLEVIDEYSLEGVGMYYKCAIEYDSTNNCYWLMTSNGFNGSIGQISKLTVNMKNGKVEEVAKWYLGASASAGWTGITTDGAYLYINLWKSQYSEIYKIQINSDGTLGPSSSPSGTQIYSVDATMDFTNSTATATCDSTAKYRVGMRLWDFANTYLPFSAASYSIASIQSTTGFTMNSGSGVTVGTNVSIIVADANMMFRSAVASYYINDLFNYSSTEIGFITCNVATVTLKFLTKSTMVAGSSDITGFGNYIGGTNSNNRTLTKYNNDLYIRMDDTADDKRFIYKFNLTTDIVSNAVIKSSGRFENTRNVDGDGAGGITVGSKGDLLEVVSTASNGKFIARRALKNALWAENQVVGETASIAGVTAPMMCMVDDDGNDWTGDNTVSNNTSKMYRFNRTTGVTAYVTLNNLGAGNNSLPDACHDGTNVYIICYYATGAIYRILKGTLASLKAGLGGTITVGSGGWAYLTNPTAANTDVLTGIAYDSVAGKLIINNNGNTTHGTIDTLTTDGVTWTEAVYDLPASTNTWRGLAYKNEKFFINDLTNATTPVRTMVLDKSLSTASAWYRTHIYQDPSDVFTGGNACRFCIDFDSSGNLVSINQTSKRFVTMKVLEDPDVMQLHTFLDSNNILLSNWVMTTTPITERYFKPEQFSDPRNVPDQFYCAVGYGNEGFSVLHLDEFLNGKSSTGKDRYNVSDIRVWHFKRGAGNFADGANTGSDTYSIFIEKDIVIRAKGLTGAGYGIVQVIDLKSGQATNLSDTVNLWSGWHQYGSYSERNDAKNWFGIHNPELMLSTSGTTYVRKLHARTFTKEDESDYSGINPVTFVAIGTDGGCDLLRIDWDSNGNRTPVKVWNNVFNDAGQGRYGNFIAPSGKIFGSDYAASGNVSLVSRVTNDKIPLLVWEINADAGSPGSTYSYIGSGILGGYGTDISPNSRCWKTSSGTWRHQLICGVMDLSGGGEGATTVVDIENISIEKLIFNTSNDYHSSSVDIFEDKIISTNTIYIDTPIQFNIMKKRRFNSKEYTPWGVFYNNWDDESGFSIRSISRPVFAIGINAVSGSGDVYTGLRTRYSKDFNSIMIGNKSNGLQLLFMPQQNNAVYESKDFTIDNPNKIIYSETILSPFSDEI